MDEAQVGVQLENLASSEEGLHNEELAKLKELYESIFPVQLNERGDETPEQVVKDRAARLFDAIDIDHDGKIGKSDLNTVRSGHREPSKSLFQKIQGHLFREQQEKFREGLDERERIKYDSLPLDDPDRPNPIVGMLKEQFVELWSKAHTQPKSQLPEDQRELWDVLIEFVMGHLEKEIPAGVQEILDLERQRTDPDSDKFDLAAHMEANRDRMHGPNDEITIAMKNLSFETIRAEKDQPSTVLSSLLDMITGCCTSFEKLWSENDTYAIFEGLDAIARHGEMTLVVGPPGSGKSTLLKLLSCRYRKHAGAAGRYHGQLKFNGNDMCSELERLVNLVLPFDEHLPLLSVGDTFSFAHENSDPINLKNLEEKSLAHAQEAVAAEWVTKGKLTSLAFESAKENKTFDRETLGLDEEQYAALESECKNVAEKTREHRANRRESTVNVVLRVLRLSHVKDTVVGNTMIRGVSGGERRRVSLGESILKKVPLMFCDEITNGLDANSAFRVTDDLRLLCKSFGATVFTALLQPSQAVYDLFDRVIMMDEGNVVYSGKRALPDSDGVVQDKVLEYFDSIGLHKPGHLPTPDFLDQIRKNAEGFREGWRKWVEKLPHEEKERREHELKARMKVLEGSNTEQVDTAGICYPKTSAQFNQVWQNGKECEQNREEVDAELARKPIEFDPMYKKDYPHSFCHNLKSLTARQWKLILTDRAAIRQAITQAIFLGILAGTLFFDLDLSIDSASSRAGLLFFIMSNVTFSTFAQLPTVMTERGVFYKQKRMGLVRTSAYVPAAMIAAFPVDTVKSVVFATIVYWLAGFQSEIDKFFYFVLLVWVLSLTMGQFARAIAAVTPEVSMAQAVAPIIGIMFMSFCGYLLRMDDIKPYFIWIYWASPIHYGFEAMMLNEVSDLTYVCTGTVTSSGTTSDCPLFTNGTGQLDYYGYQTEDSKKWMDLVILVGFCVFFTSCSLLAYHFVRYDIAPSSGKTKSEASRGDDKPATKPTVLAKQKLDIPLAFNNLTYDVTIPNEDGQGTQQLRLLKGCFGYFNPGSATALMGSSGAGKSTLMDVLANMKTGGTIRGDIFICKKPLEKVDEGLEEGALKPDPYFRRYVGYVEQSDIHMETQTVREAFMFSAQTRLGLCKTCKQEITEDDQISMVDYTLDMLDLKQSAHIQIADLDSQEKKRCTMGVELASDPAILFLDEPTSGLDSVGALTVMDCIEKIKKSGVTVICTIHQPAESLFEYFDMLLLLKKGGYQVYFGPCPKRSTDQSFKSMPLDFFRGLKDAPEWKKNNPADYILDFCDAGKDFDKQYQGHSAGIKLRDMIKAHSYYEKDPQKPEYEHEYAIQGTCSQTKILLSRSAADFWRSPDYNTVRMLVALFTGLLIGLMFLRLDDSMSGCQNKISALFLGVLIQVTGMLQAANPIFNQRAVHFRERKSMCYKEHAYFITIFAVELPYLLIAVNIFVWIIFFMVNFNTDSGRVLYFWLFLVTYQVYNIALGQFLATISPTKAVASALGPAFSTLFSLTAGFMILPSQIPNYWKWLYWVSPTHYALEGLCANELQGKMCGTSTGESVLDSLDMDYDNRWRNYFIVLGYALALRTATMFVLKHVEHIKR